MVQGVSRLLLGCGVTASVLFVVTFLVDGATRAGYRPTYHPVSALALGSRGWMQTLNFLITGSLMVAAAIGLVRVTDSTIGPVFVALFGVSLMASGIFPMDAMRGYPPGTDPGTPSVTSRAHKLHDVFGFVVFSSLPAAAIAFAVSLTDFGWKVYSAVTAIAVIGLFVTFGAAWERDSPKTGLFQRLAITVGWTWIALLCLNLL
jgi:hypothetical protein